MAPGDKRTNGCKWWSFCISRKRSPRHQLLDELRQAEAAGEEGPPPPVEEEPVHSGAQYLLYVLRQKEQAFVRVNRERQKEKEKKNAASKKKGEDQREEVDDEKGKDQVEEDDEITVGWGNPDTADPFYRALADLTEKEEKAREEAAELALRARLRERRNVPPLHGEEKKDKEPADDEAPSDWTNHPFNLGLFICENKVPEDDDVELQRALQRSMDDHMGASSSKTKPVGRTECSRCSGDERRLHTWSRCWHLICDDCMENYLDHMINNKVWKVKCRVKGCRETMTAEECQVFLPDNQDRINDWIASIPEAVRTS